ncbi:hypothetical protein ACMFWY_09220 [Roseiconus sp. JC912]|uniref:hypothetical protein n=1 Tax=Roseiconus sp. JC912 TaxID=3396307 RepID=UPI003A4C568F
MSFDSPSRKRNRFVESSDTGYQALQMGLGRLPAQTRGPRPKDFYIQLIDHSYLEPQAGVKRLIIDYSYLEPKTGAKLLIEVGSDSGESQAGA